MRTKRIATTAWTVGALVAMLAITQAHANEGPHKGSPHCAQFESTYEYKTMNWNPPFADARLKETMAKLAEAGAAGYKVTDSLSDGTGAQVLFLRKEISRCTAWK
jgi:hypothetical protein